MCGCCVFLWHTIVCPVECGSFFVVLVVAALLARSLLVILTPKIFVNQSLYLYHFFGICTFFFCVNFVNFHTVFTQNKIYWFVVIVLHSVCVCVFVNIFCIFLLTIRPFRLAGSLVMWFVGDSAVEEGVYYYYVSSSTSSS